MDIQALKLELVETLVNTNDASVLTKVKRLLELLRARSAQTKEEHDEDLIAAASVLVQQRMARTSRTSVAWC
ncbi:MAG: hypothetical protein IPM12_16000 [Flavobacteriales bacterium]|nr:hypothetical protein [Flavobacteriales bacterium]